ncbi:MAG TPA: methyltransferase domain-containing protein [Candidatus Sulfotelmatobacter sp.]|jgi:trans-aconitate methyltransferase|nr:methyltransferase domain-containing protein [Candidatus Sulfotelmatobacter sp.]
MTNQWDAGQYDAKHAFVYEKAKVLVDLLAPKAGERILDLGCGTGVLTAEIAARGAEIFGVDRSEEMVAQARSKFPALKFEVVDATQLKFDAEFDAVFSNAVLHWIPEGEKVIGGFARALKPGGRFVAEFGGRGNIKTLVKAFHRAFATLGLREPEGVSPWFYPSIAEYSGLLEKHGLEVRQASLFERPTVLEDGTRGLENWIRVFRQTYIEKLGEAAAAKWIREVERQCRPLLFHEGDWVLDYRRLRLVAVRSLPQGIE